MSAAWAGPRGLARRLLFAGICGAQAAAACFAASAQTHEPYTPADDALVLEQVTLPHAPGVLQLREVRAQWLSAPWNYAVSLAYARVALEVGRQEDDPRYFGYAESALRPWLERAEPPPEARLLRASLRQARKDFGGAAQDLDALVAGALPESAQALLARAGLRLIEGDPAASRRDCTALAGRVDAVLAGICGNAARGLSGAALPSLAALGALQAAARGSSLPVQVWLLGTAAGIADRLGRTDAALSDYAQAQRLEAAAGTRDPAMLAAYADCLLEHGRSAEVLALLDSSPRIDSLLLRLALAERRLGDGGDAAMAARADAHGANLGERFAEARQRGDNLHLREEAMYELGLRYDPAQALELAQQNWQQQREPIDARIFLRAALARHDAAAAQPVLAWMRQTQVEDVYLAALAAQLDAHATPAPAKPPKPGEAAR